MKTHNQIVRVPRAGAILQESSKTVARTVSPQTVNAVCGKKNHTLLPNALSPSHGDERPPFQQ